MWSLLRSILSEHTLLTTENHFAGLELALFRNTNLKKVLTYFVSIWGLTILKTGLIISDIYTCTKLLAFNTWSNNYIKPFIPFQISKWIFSTCIILSVLLMLGKLSVGWRVYKSGNISLVYVNSCARRIYCLQNYSVYCLFDKITPSGYLQRLTFFCFFELRNSFTLLFADTPRQFVNGLTLWSVLLTTSGDDSFSSLTHLKSFPSIISRIKWIVMTNREESIILCSMLFSFILWSILFIKFIVACMCIVQVHKFVRNELGFETVAEYVCVTVSYNIDYLVEKYRYRRFYSLVELLDVDKDFGEDTKLCDSWYCDVEHGSCLSDESSISVSLCNSIFGGNKDILRLLINRYSYSDLARLSLVETPNSTGGKTLRDIF